MPPSVVALYRSSPATHQIRPWWSKLGGRSSRSFRTASIAAGGVGDVRNCLRSTLSPRFCNATRLRVIGLRRGIAEDHEVPRVVGGRRQQPLVVRVAADDSVEDDHVGRLDVVALDGDVAEEPHGLALESRLAKERLRFVVVGRRELEVHGGGRAAPQQLDLDLTHTAADLEHRGPREPTLLEGT